MPERTRPDWTRLDWTPQDSHHRRTPTGPCTNRLALRLALVLPCAALLTLAAILTGNVAAQEPPQARIEIAEHPELGQHLVDGDGRTLYLFVDPDTLGDEPDTVREGLREATPRCGASCTAVWPQVRTRGTPSAGPGVEADLLYAIGEGAARQVVYDGWPLYRFVSDADPGDALGQGIAPPDRQAFGGTWYAVAPDGGPIEVELAEPAADDEGDDDGAEDEDEEDDEDEDGGGGYY